MVKVLTECFQDDYDFIDGPKKIKWDKDISYRFENILQSPEYVLKSEQLFSTQGVACQEDIDCVTQNLTDLLVEGTLSANFSETKDKVKRKKSKKRTNRKFFHPK
jgi:hypothetical protein